MALGPPPREAEPDNFVPLEDVSGILRMSNMNVGRLVAEGRLQAATLGDQPGVMKDSLEAEIELRCHFWRRLRAAIKSFVRWL